MNDLIIPTKSHPIRVVFTSTDLEYIDKTHIVISSEAVYNSNIKLQCTGSLCKTCQFSAKINENHVKCKESLLAFINPILSKSFPELYI